MSKLWDAIKRVERERARTQGWGVAADPAQEPSSRESCETADEAEDELLAQGRVTTPSR